MKLKQRYEADLSTWNRCANTYEQAIVCGHPDVFAYEAFEEELLDAMLHYLFRDAQQAVRLLDVGCGSARLHVRYARKMAMPESAVASGFTLDPTLAAGLIEVTGVDFSHKMLDIARQKLSSLGVETAESSRFRLRQGSAFDLQPSAGAGIPVAVALCNTIGVMQGPEGAQRLFQALRRVVESQGGIAMISAYRKDAVSGYALGNYESTMNVSGQPCWLRPKRFASRTITPIPLEIKRAYDPKPNIRVAGQGPDGVMTGEYVLERDEAAAQEVVETGHIRTYWGYESHWYSMEQMAVWAARHWSGLPTWHIAGRQLDSLRAAPAQLLILDTGGRLDTFFSRLGVRTGAQPREQ